MAQSSTLPGTLNFYLVAGDTFGHLLTLTHSDGTAATETNAYTIEQAGVYIDGVLTSFTVTRPTTNTINIALTGVQTAAIGAGVFTWLLSWDEGSDAIRTVLTGRMTIEEIP